MLAIGFTVVRIAFDLQFTRGVHADFTKYFLPSLHEAQNWKSIFWIVAPIFLLNVTRYGVHRIGEAVFFVTAALTLTFKLFGVPAVLAGSDYQDIGLLYNGSMNPALLAITGLFVRRAKVYFLGLILTTLVIYDSHQITPILVLGAIEFAGLRDIYSFIGASWIWSCCFFAIWFSGSQALNWQLHAAPRFSEYAFFWHAFREHWSLWWGMGPGKFFIYGPLLESLSGRRDDIWFYLHSDWFQILIENGIIGAALWFWVWVDVLRKNFREDRVLFQATVGMSVLMVSYFPLHASASALVVILCLSGLRHEKSVSDI